MFHERQCLIHMKPKIIVITYKIRIMGNGASQQNINTKTLQQLKITPKIIEKKMQKKPTRKIIGQRKYHHQSNLDIKLSVNQIAELNQFENKPKSQEKNRKQGLDYIEQFQLQKKNHEQSSNITKDIQQKKQSLVNQPSYKQTEQPHIVNNNKIQNSNLVRKKIKNTKNIVVNGAIPSYKQITSQMQSLQLRINKAQQTAPMIFQTLD